MWAPPRELPGAIIFLLYINDAAVIMSHKDKVSVENILSVEVEKIAVWLFE